MKFPFASLRYDSAFMNTKCHVKFQRTLDVISTSRYFHFVLRLLLKGFSMKKHLVRVHPSKEKLARKDQLAWKIAEIASDPAAVQKDVLDMVINRMIDNASVAVASVNRKPVASARSMAIAHPRATGATVFGMPNDQRFDCEWAAWANFEQQNTLTQVTIFLPF
jgi:hypothetical protein